MTHFKNQIRRIAVTAVAIATIALMSGCASTLSAKQGLERWNPGENKDLVLVRAIVPLNAAEFDPMCKQGKLPASLKGVADEEKLVAFVQRTICENFTEWRAIRGFTKSDFGKGAILAVGLIQPGKDVNVDDIVETSILLATDGRVTRSPLVTRVIRKNALKERDPTCYWDGQSGRFDAFATGGVVCPSEGWDWRDQKWAKK